MSARNNNPRSARSATLPRGPTATPRKRGEHGGAGPEPGGPPGGPQSAGSARRKHPPGSATLPRGPTATTRKRGEHGGAGPEPGGPGYGRLNAGGGAGGSAGQEPGGPTGGPIWWDRGYQPHVESPHLIQHVCFRLADSLPREVVEQMDAELKSMPPLLRDPEKEKRVNAYLDAGRGSCILQVPAIAELVQNALLHFQDVRCTLHEWCIMPNHVHVLFQTKEGWTMSSIVASWKSYTGKRISAYRQSAGLEPGGPTGGYAGLPPGPSKTATLERGVPSRVWHREYWDRYVRNEAHYATVVDYIRNNPVKAGLVTRPEDWKFSSAGWSATLERGSSPATPERGGPNSAGQEPGGPTNGGPI